MKKRHIVITAVITFYITLFVCFMLATKFITGGYGLNGSLITKLMRIDNLLEHSFIFDYDKKAAEQNALEGYLAACNDVYTEYISENEFVEYKRSSEGKYKGIGVVVSISGEDVTIISVNPESPASKAKMQPGDIIKKVNGVAVSSESYNEMLSIIRGTDKRGKDDKLSIEISRNNQQIVLDVVREEVESITVSSQLIDGDIGYIRISSFEGSTSEQFNKAVENFTQKNVKGFIFDVRNNPGGTLGSVLDVTDRVLKDGIILTIRSKSGKDEIFRAEDDDSIDIPVCVIANKSSASAAEVFTAALKENNVATFVGETTFGKGIVQSVYPLGDDTAVKLTTAKYYTPNGTCIHEIGVAPDYDVKLDEKYADLTISELGFDKDLQLKKAVEVIRNK